MITLERLLKLGEEEANRLGFVADIVYQNDDGTVVVEGATLDWFRPEMTEEHARAYLRSTIIMVTDTSGT
jgi:hypothetical protein